MESTFSRFFSAADLTASAFQATFSYCSAYGGVPGATAGGIADLSDCCSSGHISVRQENLSGEISSVGKNGGGGRTANLALGFLCPLSHVWIWRPATDGHISETGVIGGLGYSKNTRTFSPIRGLYALTGSGMSPGVGQKPAALLCSLLDGDATFVHAPLWHWTKFYAR